MKVGVIIPTRGDRPLFKKNCLRLLQNQTLPPNTILFVDQPPESEECDITKRYRFGYDYFRGKDFDVLAFMEDDDWYHSQYLEIMIQKWQEHGRPELFGTNYTIYYNIRLFRYFTMRHTQRSAAMSTLIKPDMNFTWCKDSEAYTDSHLWFSATHLSTKKRLISNVFKPEFNICLGIKHGVGKTGGLNHLTALHRYIGANATDDRSKDFLMKTVDVESFEFYCNYFKNNST